MSDQIPLTDELCFRALMENSADSIYFKDRKCRLQRLSRKMALDLGFKHQEDIYGKTDIDLFGDEFGKRTLIDDLRIMETGEPIIGLVESRRLKDGDINWTTTTKLPVHDVDGSVIGLMGITREINELKENEINLQYLATHDSLTELPNRYLMNDRLEQILTLSKRTRSVFSIFFMDLNGFKTVNDSFGHEVGDLLLREVANRLKDCVRPSDTVARFGGDEFVIIFVGLAHAQDVLILANRVKSSFADLFLIKDHQIKVTAGMGISLYPDHGEDLETLIKAADYAMYLSKKRAKDFVICPPDKYSDDRGDST